MPLISIGPQCSYKIIVDDEDVALVMQRKWYFKKRRRVVTADSEQVSIGNYLLSPPEGRVVDHIDGNPLNNSRSNLRICTQRQNGKNKHGVSNVYLWRGRWRAKIRHDYVDIHIGMFDTKEEAAQAVRDKKSELYGEFAP